MAEALIALGGNVGDVRETLDRATAALCDGAVVRLVARSSDYRTPPWGVADQPPFINRAIIIETALPPLDLLTRAQAVERQFGRDRSREQRWGPRTLDLDLLLYGALTVDDASPITLVDSASVASASGQATPAWASADGAPVLVYDVDASRALTTAATSDVAITRAEALAEASAFAALAVAADPTAPVLVVLNGRAGQGDRLGGSVELARLDLLGSCPVCLAALCHLLLLLVQLWSADRARPCHDEVCCW